MSDNPFGLHGYTASTYGDAFADVYDEWYGSLGDHDLVDALVRNAPPGASDILELGVGTGRLLARLVAARAGTPDRLTGIDTSDAMVTRARSVPSLSTAHLVTGDFSETLPPGEWDLVFCGYNTFFNLADEESMMRALVLVRSALRDSGRLVLDAFVPGPDTGGDRVGIRSITTESVVLTVSRHDDREKRIIGQFVELRNGAPVRLRPWAVRYVLPAELDTLAERAGLRLLERHADGSSTTFTPESQRHVSVYSPS